VILVDLSYPCAGSVSIAPVKGGVNHVDFHELLGSTRPDGSLGAKLGLAVSYGKRLDPTDESVM